MSCPPHGMSCPPKRELCRVVGMSCPPQRALQSAQHEPSPIMRALQSGWHELSLTKHQGCDDGQGTMYSCMNLATRGAMLAEIHCLHSTGGTAALYCLTALYCLDALCCLVAMKWLLCTARGSDQGFV